LTPHILLYYESIFAHLNFLLPWISTGRFGRARRYLHL